MSASDQAVPAAVTDSQLNTAYSVCRRIARSSAKNFYYAFMALPRPKRDALSAVYAFMRHSDDLSDDPGRLPAERLARLEDWRNQMHSVLAGGVSDEPVLLALADTVRVFRIKPELLDALVEGTAMDVREMLDGPGLKLSFETFDELYKYCYHVASVVGLICIRIFGYEDPAAEKLAEQCGVAFQLTNIIRDVKEDAAMSRIYLPKEDLAMFGLSASALRSPEIERLRPVLELEAERARSYYRAAEELIPLIEPDSQPALWVLVTIYRRLLDKIAECGYDVFRHRVRLTKTEKVAILTRGLARRFTA
ncbi:MAG TPA: phytoene/squalene synthase family protein [Terriglobales bacterium]|nr:phytoene/squalene synthase family protein [Terriglobales bacterium]